MLNKVLQTILKRKLITGAVIVVAVGGMYFVFHGGSAEARYVLAAVEKGTIVTSISGSGQVAASQQVDVKAKVSGDVTYVGVKAGQEVRAGQVLAYLDSRTAQKSVRDAEINLRSAEISLEKLRRDQQAGSVTTIDDLDQSYRDAYNKVSDAFLNLPGLIDTTRAVMYDSTLYDGCTPNLCAFINLIGDEKEDSFKALTQRAERDYEVAKKAYDPNFASYKDIRLDASPMEVTDILTTTERTAELLAQAAKSEQNFLDTLVNDINDRAASQNHKGQVPSQVTQYQNNLASAISNLNSIISSLTNAEHSITNAQRSLDDGKLTDPLDIVSQENTVAQRQAALADARETLANYVVRAPFAGKVAKADVKKGDTASGSTIFATLLTKQSIAEISMNEVDVASVHVNQKATLTFDALEDLTISGTVLEVDSLGTVSQGVVTYSIVIGFDTQDEKVKPGMSVSAAIITDSKQDVLLVPNSAVKSAGGGSYVEIPVDTAGAQQLMANGATSAGVALNGQLQQYMVEVGLSNDSFTEVTGGLKEGDIVITRTITSATTSSTTQNRSLLPTGGNRGATGGGIRTQVR